MDKEEMAQWLRTTGAAVTRGTLRPYKQTYLNGADESIVIALSAFVVENLAQAIEAEGT